MIKLNLLSQVWIYLKENIENAGLIFTGLDFDRHDFQDPGKKISTQSFNQFWLNAINYTRDSNLGLNAGSIFIPGYYGAVFFFAQNSINLLQGLERFISFNNSCNNMVSMKSRLGNGQVVVTASGQGLLKALPAYSAHQMICLYSGCLIKGISVLAGQEMPPRQLLLPVAKPPGKSPLKLAAHKVVYESDHCQVIFDQADLSIPIALKEPGPKSIYQQQQQELIARFHSNGLKSTVQRKIVGLLDGHIPALTSVANSLNISERTLQRKLKAQGLQYRQILNTTLEIIAKQYLKSGVLSMKEIAFSLGYSSPTAFIQAFKNQTGYTPAEYVKKK